MGTALPPLAISQEEAARLATTFHCGPNQRAIGALYRRSGVKSRGSVLLGDPPERIFYPAAVDALDRGPTTAARMQRYAVEAPKLAMQACRRALDGGGVRGGDVTHLVTVSCSGFASPGVDLELVSSLELSPAIARTHLGFMGCHGLLNGLRVAGAFAACEPGAAVLVCAVELCTLHHQYNCDAQQIVANALFGDGAAAVVVRSTPGAERGRRLRAQRSCVVPGTADLMTWQIGDYGFEMTLSPRVPDVIRETLGPWLEHWLQSCGLTAADIRSWAVHPGGPRILSATAEAIGFDPALLKPSQDVLECYGNLSSPTVAFILEHLNAIEARGPCVMLAFGPGMTIEAALLTDD